MKVRIAEVREQAIQLREPYTIAYETISTAPVVFLRIPTDTGLAGFGCASPDLPVTGETTEFVLFLGWPRRTGAFAKVLLFLQK